MKTSSPRPRSWAALALLFACLTSCSGLTSSQRGSLREFSAATIDLGSLAAEQFAEARADVLEMNRLRLELGDEIDGELDWPLTLERTALRVNSMRALESYGRLLDTLLMSSRDEELASASDTFVSSIRGVQGVTLDDQQAGAISSVVQFGASWWVEKARAKAVRSVMTDSHEAILLLIDSLESSLDPEGDEWSLAFDTAAVFLSTAADGQGALPLAGRAKALARSKQARFRSMNARILEACASLRSAQEEALSVLDSKLPRLEDIRAYHQKVRELIDVYKILSKD